MTTVLVLGTSVLASLIAVFLIWVGRILWDHWIQKLWLGLSLRNIIDISGKWCSLDVIMGDKYSYNETLHLRQRGWKIEGILIYKETPLSDSKKNETKLFKLQGVF